jgi:hypothetical protein
MDTPRNRDGALFRRTSTEGANRAASASVVRFENGKITQWSDYYDGLQSRRSAVAAFFTDWIEL